MGGDRDRLASAGERGYAPVRGRAAATRSGDDLRYIRVDGRRRTVAGKGDGDQFFGPTAADRSAQYSEFFRSSLVYGPGLLDRCKPATGRGHHQQLRCLRRLGCSECTECSGRTVCEFLCCVLLYRRGDQRCNPATGMRHHRDRVRLRRIGKCEPGAVGRGHPRRYRGRPDVDPHRLSGARNPR